jgi:hypothetical protein
MSKRFKRGRRKDVHGKSTHEKKDFKIIQEADKRPEEEIRKLSTYFHGNIP